jgi:pantoate--beta-alanine ligase
VDDIYDGKVIIATIRFDGLENQMEGKFRPGHFDGEIVTSFWDVILNNAYFGEKDFQQLQIAKKMVSKQPRSQRYWCAIYRESNGSAMTEHDWQIKAKEKTVLILKP